MSDFNEALRLFDLIEGGFSNSKIDKGGATFKGISLRFLQLLGVKRGGDINGDGVIDIRDILALKQHEPKRAELLRIHFWDAYRIGEIRNQTLANKFFLFITNCDYRAATVLQRAVNDVSRAKLLVDGIIGSKTISAVNLCDGDSLTRAFTIQAIQWYLRIVQKDRSQKGNFEGWVKRALY